MTLFDKASIYIRHVGFSAVMTAISIWVATVLMDVIFSGYSWLLTTIGALGCIVTLPLSVIFGVGLILDIGVTARRIEMMEERDR